MRSRSRCEALRLYGDNRFVLRGQRRGDDYGSYAARSEDCEPEPLRAGESSVGRDFAEHASRAWAAAGDCAAGDRDWARGQSLSLGRGHVVDDAVCQLWGEGRNKLPLVLVEDVARGLVAAMEKPGIEGRSFNLVADPCLSAQEYLDELGPRGEDEGSALSHADSCASI